MAHLGLTTNEEYSALIEEVIAPLGGVPTLPVIATRLLSTIEDPDSSAADVARLLAGDQALVANLLKSANSAYFSIGRRVNSVTDAIVLIGLNGVRQLVLSISVIDVFGRPGAGENLDYARLWRHSITVATAGRLLAARADLNLETGFLCGLLHDLGKVILSRARPEEYGEAQTLAREQSISIHDAERRVFGFDHGELGGYAMDAWHFPTGMIHGCRYHHSLQANTPDWSSVALVHVADCITWGVTRVPCVAPPVIVDAALRALGLEQDSLDELREKAEAEANARWRSLIA